MEARGYLERRADPADRRAKVFRLTAKARQLHRAALAVSRRLERATRGPGQLRRFSLRDTYGVAVAAGQDEVLILAAAVCIDEMSEREHEH